MFYLMCNWQTDGRYIVEETKGEVETVLKATIRQARSSDAGTYVCSARNRKGSTKQQFTLSIQGKCRPLGHLDNPHYRSLMQLR